MRRYRALLIVAMVFLAGCGDDAVDTSTTSPASTTTSAAATTTGAGPTTTTAAVTTTFATTTTSAPPPSAADSLAAFFAAAEALDADAKAAAAAFNAGFDADAGTLDPAVTPIVEALDGRIAAMAGGMRYLGYPDLTGALDCLEGGGAPATRFASDLAAARDLAQDEAPPAAATDSEEAGILAVRLAAIHSMNWGCDSCGGLEYDAPIAVDWAGRTVADGVQFEADFAGGTWHVEIWAC
jgi:hypothetical protein